MHKTLGSMTLEEVESKIGSTIITQELNGDVLIAKLRRVNPNNNGSILSIAVSEGEDENLLTVWPSQWFNAVFV